ncbi:hypothetical protein NEMBOFW57_000727 [Staphylotrichum longicolle]|uniref:Ecp2 effector protein-like domain-containing protein n=1 Tax=Staphylotrichum longicolle TaxID=669026 RepID=A0AAD4F0Q6_9PEZI|nr:hypothetical protein NEMBOFW57_000727 [Staphylotrichum longicolle]
MQAAFKHNVNKIIAGWRDTTARALERLFDGTDQSTNPGSSVNYLTYPCGIPPDPNSCGTSSFDDMTSDVSPLASDCLQIIRNFKGNGGTMWQTQILGKTRGKLPATGGVALVSRRSNKG